MTRKVTKKKASKKSPDNESAEDSSTDCCAYFFIPILVVSLILCGISLWKDSSKIKRGDCVYAEYKYLANMESAYGIAQEDESNYGSVKIRHADGNTSFADAEYLEVVSCGEFLVRYLENHKEKYELN